MLFLYFAGTQSETCQTCDVGIQCELLTDQSNDANSDGGDAKGDKTYSIENDLSKREICTTYSWSTRYVNYIQWYNYYRYISCSSKSQCYIVFETELLFKFCQNCHLPVSKLSKHIFGTHVRITQ